MSLVSFASLDRQTYNYGSGNYTVFGNISAPNLYSYYLNASQSSNISIFPNFNTQSYRAGLNRTYSLSDAAQLPTKLKSNLASPELLKTGYDAEKGQKLANIASKNAIGFNGQCATYAKKAIQEAGLGKYEYGHAYQCADILSRNPNFKEISTVGLDLEKLPAGCILVYDRGVANYSKQYGHIEITDGKGNAKSDGTTRNIRNGARVFIPV